VRAFVVSILVLISAVAQASEHRVHTLLNGHQVVSEVDRGTRETFVLLNGLVYATSRWDEVAQELSAAGYTVVRMNYVAQPESLRLLGENEEPGFFKTGLSLQTLASDVRETLSQLEVDSKIDLVGLSYGASVATEFALRFPDQVEQLVLMSPLVVSLDSYDQGGAALRAWLDGVRKTENFSCDLYGKFNPLLCAARDYWYELYYSSIYGPYLDKRIKDIPDGVTASVHKKAMFHLVRAARDFNLKESAKDLKNVHLLVASEDEKPLRADQDLVWKNFSQAERRSYIEFKGTHHALPDEAPTQVFEILDAIARQEPRVMQGSRLEVQTH
jgi:pimeloyl-ACP methyl ester carboxylesterase